jgi:hypothetical protein
MIRTAQRFGLGLVAAASLAGLGLVAEPARADRKLACDMKGTWVEQKDDFAFQATYQAKDGPDTFDGLYTNPSAGAAAHVKGTASKGTWLIVLDYIDPKHRGQTRELSGTGTMLPTNQLEVKGSYVYKQEGREIGKGNFVLVGKCR